MPNFKELDPTVGFQHQLDAATGPIVLANVMNVPADQVDQLVQVWAADATFMRAQPGFISTQLHRGVARQISVHHSSRLRLRRRAMKKAWMASVAAG